MPIILYFCTFILKMSKIIFNKTFVISCLLLLLFSCGEYSKLIKSDDNDLKFKAGVDYYKNSKYDRALPLFEDVLAAWKGQEKSEEVFYYYCYTQYGMGNLPAASFHFKNFTETFFTSKHLAECAFMVAQCEYEMSLPTELDQSQTQKAIQELQLFINLHPESTYIDSCNFLIDDLRKQLIKKQIDQAKLYFNTERYKSSIKAFELVMQDYPGIENKDEVEYYIVKSHQEYAANSVQKKKLARWESTLTKANEFLSAYTTKSKYYNKVKSISSIAAKKIKVLKNK